MWEENGEEDGEEDGGRVRLGAPCGACSTVAAVAAVRMSLSTVVAVVRCLLCLRRRSTCRAMGVRGCARPADRLHDI